MNFLKNLFGGGGQPADRNALYIYVQPKHCQEILQVRINLMNDPSLTDDGKGYFVRKVASATRCPFQAEIEIYMDNKKNITNSVVTNGTLVDEADYLAQQADD